MNIFFIISRPGVKLAGELEEHVYSYVLLSIKAVFFFFLAKLCFTYIFCVLGTLMCLSIGTPKNNKFSICSKWKIHYF